MDDHLAEAVRELGVLRGELRRLREIDIELFTPGAAELPAVEFGGLKVFLLHILVYNRAGGANFTARVVDQSLDRGAYPIGSFPLRWQIPNQTTAQWIGRNSDGRIDVAWVFPTRNSLCFLGPGDLYWAEYVYSVDYLTGLIDIGIVGRDDAVQRVQFRLSTGLRDPIDLFIKKVGHG